MAKLLNHIITCCSEETITCEQQVIMSDLFKSRHKFYTALISKSIAIWGFLAPDDNFDFNKVTPKNWSEYSISSIFDYKNYKVLENNMSLKEYHIILSNKILDKNLNFCPQRLRKYRR